MESVHILAHEAVCLGSSQNPCVFNTVTVAHLKTYMNEHKMALCKDLKAELLRQVKNHVNSIIEMVHSYTLLLPLLLPHMRPPYTLPVAMPASFEECLAHLDTLLQPSAEAAAAEA